MRDVYIASFCHEGVLGGAIYLKEDKAIYRTNKATVDEKYRNLEMPYKDMTELKSGHCLFFPTVTVTLKEGAAYKFIVFFRKRFLRRVEELCDE